MFINFIKQAWWTGWGSWCDHVLDVGSTIGHIRQVPVTKCASVHVIKLFSRHSNYDGSKRETELMTILTTVFLLEYLLLHKPMISSLS